MLTASCHCGAVSIEVARRPRSLTQCTCSICRRYGALWYYCTRHSAHVRARRGATIPYSWNDRTIVFHHCSTCGCVTHYTGTRRAKRDRIAVNARMLAPADIANARIRTFDGADTWKYLD